MGQQGRRIRDDGDLEVWARPPGDGSRAVVLFNRSEQAAEIPVDWPEIGLTRTLSAEVRDLWEHRSRGRRTPAFPPMCLRRVS